MADSCCSGTVDIRAMEARQRRVLMIVLAINIATFAMMLAAAIYSGSSSLLSGSLDNLGDALTYLLSIAVIGASTRAKAKVALLKGLLILGAAIAVAVQIGWRLAHPEVPVFEAMGVAALRRGSARATTCSKVWRFCWQPWASGFSRPAGPICSLPQPCW